MTDAEFAALVDELSPSLLRVALGYVPSREVAEEVVQDTWVGVIQGIERFEGRSSLRTWIYRILTNTAKKRGGRERRSMPFSSLGRVDDEQRDPVGWRWLPDEWLLARETIEVVKRSIGNLPASQRKVIAMRDIAGYTAEEVADALDLSAGNQRVLLHRARSRVRTALRSHLE